MTDKKTLDRVRSLARHGATLTGQGPKMLEAGIVRLTEENKQLRTNLARAIEIARDMRIELEDVHFRGADNAYCDSCGTIYPCNIILKVRAFGAELDAMTADMEKEGEK